MSAGNESTASEYGISVSIDTVPTSVPGVSALTLKVSAGDLMQELSLGVRVETDHGIIHVLSFGQNGMRILGAKRAATLVGIPVFTRKPSESSDGPNE